MSTDGIAQHHLRRLRTGHVAGHRAFAVDVDAVGGREPHRVPVHLLDVREHARGRRLAVGAGDRGDGDPRGRAGGEQHVHDRARDVARLAFAGRDVHAETGRRVDLADAAADLAVALADVRGDEVHAAHIETDGLRGANGHLAVVRVDHVGEVDGGAAGGEVAGAAEEQGLAGWAARCRA